LIRLPATLRAWNTPGFAAALKEELAALGPAVLPLQQAAAHSSVALDSGVEVMVLGAEAADGVLRVRLGVFFSGIVAGCSCADDPTPVEPLPEYCELLLSVDGSTAAATVAFTDSSRDAQASPF
jgi:hypothetical protein